LFVYNQNVVQRLLLIFTVSFINCIYFLCSSLHVLLLRHVNWNLYEYMDMDMEVVEVSLSHGEATTTLKYTRVRNKNNTKSM